MKEFTLTATKDKSAGTTNLTLQGKLNVSHMTELHKELQKATKGSKKIKITLSKVEDADVSTIQLLKAFENTCIANKIETEFQLNLPEDIENLFTKAGLSNLL
ncbi:MAG: hypothetical protein CVU09_06985 [Bacteroidetes bacterium HGW-Bacteroidetes-4]|jgi:ABC-type transporter Mla MlaB component|nr:MAG: hypothetical protein CVU09_06985 [Bacteroidetes bacterium HGW-Bacteroidetes-4]